MQLHALALRGRRADGEFALERRSTVHVLAEPQKFGAPAREAVAGLADLHVANGDRQQVGVVLKLQQFQRGFAVPLHHVRLKIFQPTDLANRIGGEQNEKSEKDREAHPKARRGRRDGAQPLDCARDLRRIVFGNGPLHKPFRASGTESFRRRPFLHPRRKCGLRPAHRALGWSRSATRTAPARSSCPLPGQK